MRAAEQLFAERGVENVAIREIIAAANQRNESALQYHFKNLSGLIDAIHDERSQQIQAVRAELLAEQERRSARPELRQLCELMVEPPFSLACRDMAFRRYVKAFAHHPALTATSPFAAVARKGAGGKSGAQLNRMLRAALPTLDDEGFRYRMDAAVMLCSLSMARQARRRGAFRGLEAERFREHLVDALVGLLAAPVSKATKALRKPD